MQIILYTEAADENCGSALLNQKDSLVCHVDGCCRLQLAVRMNLFALAWLPPTITFSALARPLMEIGATSQCRISIVIDSTGTTSVVCMEEENFTLGL